MKGARHLSSASKSLLRFHDLGESYGTRTPFEGVTFAMTPGERLGLVGRNGTGTTTLLRLILGGSSEVGLPLILALPVAAYSYTVNLMLPNNRTSPGSSCSCRV